MTMRLPPAMWWLAAAWTMASVADNLLIFVLLWLAEPQGWSGTMTALVVLAIRLPTLLSGPVGGFAIDRLGPKRMMMADGVVRVLLMAGLMLSDYRIEVVLVLGALAGASAPLSFAAARTLVPRLVAGPEVGRANAVVGVGDQLPLLLGAALAGPGIALLGPSAVFGVPLVLMLGVIAIAARLPAAASVVEAQPGTGRPWRSPRVVGLVALSVAYYFAYGPFETVLPYLVRDQLHADIGGYTVLWLVFGAATLATLPLAPRLARHRPGAWNAVGAAAWGLCTAPIAFATDLPVAVAIFLISGAIWGPYSAIEVTALQRWTRPADHGRVFGTQRALLARPAR